MESSIIMGIAIEERNNYAAHVQDILTKHGCIIKTRLGLHEATKDNCSRRGLIILQLSKDKNLIKELEHDLLKIQGVKINSMTI
ncbi:hypothetical protein [Clostridium rectalis]|uniref:hypothetical protein n=1 Tax=Clostridium rectalis TaxID=2040295 RepID=UPI000F643C13|nr:hypothetical protein [Clostridium rectalis]